MDMYAFLLGVLVTIIGEIVGLLVLAIIAAIKRVKKYGN